MNIEQSGRSGARDYALDSEELPLDLREHLGDLAVLLGGIGISTSLSKVIEVVQEAVEESGDV